MAKRVQHIRYTSAALATTVGKDGELIINLSNRSVTVHDGATPGGFEQARANMTNVPDATVSAAGRMSTTQVTSLATVIAGLATEITDRTAADALKADLVVPSAANNVALLNAGGNLVDSGQTMAQYLADLIPTATKMVFAQAAAPTGWTQDTTYDDKVLRVVDGSGGGVGGTWSMSGITTTSNGAHTHDVVIPPTGWNYSASWGTYGRLVTFVQEANAKGPNVNRTLSNGALSAGAHTHTASGNGAWRPAYQDVIVAARD